MVMGVYMSGINEITTTIYLCDSQAGAWAPDSYPGCIPKAGGGTIANITENTQRRKSRCFWYMGALAPRAEMDPPTPQAGSGLYLANSNREFGLLFGVVSCLFGLKSPPRKKCAQWRLHTDFRLKK
jgi:hypothetical protein